MPGLTDPQVARAVRLLAEAAKAQLDAAQDLLDAADRVHSAANALHDLLLNAEQDEAAYHAGVQALRGERAS